METLTIELNNPRTLRSRIESYKTFNMKKHMNLLTVAALFFASALVAPSCDNDDQKTFKVSFETDGGTTVDDQTVIPGGKVTKPADPTKISHDFAAWYKEVELTTEWNFDSDVVNADMTLYAKWIEREFAGIENISPENYPRVDGSSSTEPLNTLIACKLLGWSYKWEPYLLGNGIWRLIPNREDIPGNFFGERIKSSQTHNSIINLIDNQTDIIISARKMSADEKSYAETLGVSLIETPIALDALDFLLNKQNPINSLTVKQIQDIYKGNITNWNKVGGANEAIKPFIRNANSGSQEMMKEIVMNNAGMPDWEVGYTDDEIIPTMAAVYTELSMYQNGICFTPHYYKEYIIRNAVGANDVKSIAINGIYSNANSIKNKTYPFVANVYVSIRSDLNRNSMAYKMYEWLQTKSGKDVIEESGYVPN